MSWTINQIDAFNSFSVVTSAMQTIPALEQTIWDRNNNYVDGSTGSTRPNFFPNTSPTSTGPFSMRIRGTAPFPASWTGATYSLAMFLGGDLVLQSAKTSVPASGQAVDVIGMYLMSPYLTTASVDIPFRWAGDFSLIIRNDISGAFMVADKTTRLELCWARATWPNGPLEPPPNVRSRVNMTPGYPIILWRLFVPSPTEFRQVQTSQLVTWYIRRVVAIVWNPNSQVPQYDTKSGRAFYVQGGLGGGYDLVAWTLARYEYCNCYDVAGITQLGCSLVMDAQGAEIADSRWVFQLPNGYINPGPLIGWVQAGGDNLRCNTPFWASAHTAPWVPPEDPSRTGFGNHAWVEVFQQRLVLDATHALQAPTPSPPAATQTRVDYLNATLDPQRDRGTATTRDRSGAGDCWQDPETQQKRIGVSNPWAQLTLHNTGLMFPEPLGSEVSAIVDRGKAPVLPVPDTNAVSLDAASLCSVLDAQLEASPPLINVSPSYIHLITSFTRESTTIIATIYVHENYESPIQQLLEYVSGFQVRPLESVIHTCEPHLGAYSFRTSNSAFWVRGNLFIRLEHFSEERFDFTLAAKLDAYLARNPVRLGPGEQLELDRGTLPGVLKRGDTFRVKLMGDPSAWAKEKNAVSSDANVVVAAGAPNEEGIFELYAVGPGKATVTILGAEKGSLRPVKSTFEVTVEDAEVENLYASMEAGEKPEPIEWVGAA